MSIKTKSLVITSDNDTISINKSTDIEKEEAFIELIEMINNFKSMSLEKIESYDRCEKIFGLYELIEKKISNLSSLKEKYSSEIIENTKDKLSSDLNDGYSSFLRRYNHWSLIEIINVNDIMKKNQILQFTISSVVMTILTFLLGNISIIASSGEIRLKMIILVNLSILTVAFFLFSFIGVFLGFIDSNNDCKAWRIFKRFFLILLPLVIIVSIILISIFMEE